MNEENANDAASVAFALADICDGKMSTVTRGYKHQQHEQIKHSLTRRRLCTINNILTNPTAFQVFNASGIMAHLQVSRPVIQFYCHC
jgi:hypothetical protein